MANPVINPTVGLSPVEGGYLAFDIFLDKLRPACAIFIGSLPIFTFTEGIHERKRNALFS
jgi:hypothetical protein